MCLQQEVVQEAQAPEGAPCEAQSQHHHLQEAHAPESAPCEDGAESQHHFQGLKFSDFATSKLQHYQKKRRQPLACQVEAIRQTLWSALGQLRLLRPSGHAKARFAFRRIPDHTEVFVDRCQSKRRSRPTEQGESVNTLLEPSIAEPESDEYVFVGSEMPDCQTRPDCQVRMKYLQKLSKERVWLQKAQRPASHQTIIIFDWDDTLFPTTEFFDVWGLPSRSKESMPPVSEETELGVQKWREALSDYLHRACSLSNCVAIVTSSRRPWVETCIERFVPSLRDLFMGESGKRPLVVYANEVLQRTRRLESQSMDLRPVRHREMDLSLTLEEYEEELTAAKYAAIKLIVKEFYSQYPQQSWKNVISLGDMSYEHDATQEVVFRHGTDNCRTKTIIVPTGPSLSEITLRLRFSYLMLPQYVHFDGDIDLNLQKAKDPLDAIATALNMKELANLSISRHAWGRTKAPEDEDSSTALEELAETLESLLVARRAREAGIRWPHL
mmetsp:Transcript_126493/g.232094  ORF Transcript_126493/g.232094 Transcript_126493/m.232094 type:complete len:498 (+) Transcript_126493:57-1550(+)